MDIKANQTEKMALDIDNWVYRDLDDAVFEFQKVNSPIKKA